MSNDADKSKKAMPKGGRKGGASFPRTHLADSVAHAKKLVSKTHSSPQPIDIIYSGVVGAKSGTGNIKISALKQYGFLQKDSKLGFSATELAKKLSAAPENEKKPFLRKAALGPIVFKKIFDTYHGDQVTKSKLKQRAADLNVHPDETDTCIDIYIKSLALADLVTIDGDQITHRSAVEDISATDSNTTTSLEMADTETSATSEIQEAEGEPAEDPEVDTGKLVGQRVETPTAKAVFNVNVTLDSSLDIEKLAKQLELLKKFGAI